MKSKIILVMLLNISAMTYAQTAMFSYSINLTLSDSIDTQKWLNEKLTQTKENELAQKYSNLINPNLREYISTSEFSDKELLQMMQNNLQNEYKDNFWLFGWDSYHYSSLLHAKLTIKAFRDLLFNKACDLLCELIAYYPKDYKTHIIQAFTDAQKMLNDIPNHKYEIKDSNPNDSWNDMIFFKDGIANRDLGYGINGFLLRRIFMDKIPLNEIKEKTTTLLNKMKAIDTSNNPSILVRYTINNEIVYCIAAEENYFISLSTNKKFYPYSDKYLRAYYPNIIKYRYNVGQGFYNISNYHWCKEKGTMIIDKNSNIIYQE